MTKLGAWSPLISPKIRFLQLFHSLHSFGILTVVQIKLLISGRKMTKPFSRASYQKQLSKGRNWISSVFLQHFWYSVGVSKISHLLTHWDIHLQLQSKPTGLQKSQKFVLICCLWCSRMFHPSSSRISHPFCSACSSMSTSPQFCAPLMLFLSWGLCLKRASLSTCSFANISLRGALRRGAVKQQCSRKKWEQNISMTRPTSQKHISRSRSGDRISG